MNERIKQLARQCNAYSKDDDGEETKIAILIGKEVEKFAELIVRECADFVSNDRQNDDYGVFVANRIKEHFGVEE